MFFSSEQAARLDPKWHRGAFSSYVVNFCNNCSKKYFGHSVIIIVVAKTREMQSLTKGRDSLYVRLISLFVFVFVCLFVCVCVCV